MERTGPLEILKKVINRLQTLYHQKRDKRLFQGHLRPTDVFLVGHPKSGNTWLAYMLAIVLYKDLKHQVTLANLKEFIPVIHGSDGAIARFKDIPNPRIFRNEWPLYPELYPKTVYLVRDPRAALTSYYHHYRVVTGDWMLNIEQFVDEYLLNGCIKQFEPCLIRWDRQVEAWLKRAERQPVKVIKYEDMLADREKVLWELSAFLGIQIGRDAIDLAVRRGSFAEMRADEEKYGAESYPGELRTRGRFIRKGKANAWQEEMPPRVADKIVTEFGPVMKKLGYL